MARDISHTQVYRQGASLYFGPPLSPQPLKPHSIPSHMRWGRWGLLIYLYDHHHIYLSVHTHMEPEVNERTSTGGGWSGSLSCVFFFLHWESWVPGPSRCFLIFSAFTDNWRIVWLDKGIVFPVMGIRERRKSAKQDAGCDWINR